MPVNEYDHEDAFRDANIYCGRQINLGQAIRSATTQAQAALILDEKHPKILANPDQSMYDYVTAVKSFTDTEVILQEKLESIDLNRILRAVNKDL
jgi:hypothetical protein